MLSKNEIYLNKRRRVVVDRGSGGSTVAMLASLLKDVGSLGFVFSPCLLDRLWSLSSAELAVWYKATVAILRPMVGAHRKYKPMYPNFPSQVMEASEAELFFNAITHYFGSCVSDLVGDPGMVVLPNYERLDRDPLDEFEGGEHKVIDLGSEEDFRLIFTRLCAANSSLPETDKEILDWFFKEYGDDIQDMIPDVIPQKETLAMLCGLAIEHCSDPGFMVRHLKTATDVLRVAVVTSDGDVSLAKPTKFRRFKRVERRFFLAALEGCDAITEDMLSRKEPWKRLARELRPGDYAKRFPDTFKAFDVVCNDEIFITFGSHVEQLLALKDWLNASRVLMARPGVFARRLDHLLRLGGSDGVVKGFLSVADRVSTPVLLQVYNHFKNRGVVGRRTFFPKGNVAKMQVSENPLSILPAAQPEAIASGVRKVLVNRFRKLSPLGKVWVDDRLKTQVVPFAMRSASKSLRTIARGSRMPLPAGSTVRLVEEWHR